MLKKEWTKAIIDWLISNCPDALQRNDTTAIWDTLSENSYELIKLDVAGYTRPHPLTTESMAFLISMMYQEQLHINNLCDVLNSGTIGWGSFGLRNINWNNVADAFEDNSDIVLVYNKALKKSGSNYIYCEAPSAKNIKFTLLLKLNSSFTFKDFTDAPFPVRGKGIDLDIILDKNYKGEGEAFDIQALINKVHNLRNYDDVNVKFKFYPIVDKNGEKTTPFKIYNYQEDVIKKANLLEPIK